MLCLKEVKEMLLLAVKFVDVKLFKTLLLKFGPLLSLGSSVFRCLYFSFSSMFLAVFNVKCKLTDFD
jgi:hypothetical protein